MTWQDAVREDDGATRILLETAAGAQEAAFPSGFNPWRGRIGVRVRAPAQEGRANQELVGVVAAFFGVPPNAVEITAGHRGSHKTVRVALERQAAVRRLARVLDAL